MTGQVGLEENPSQFKLILIQKINGSYSCVDFNNLARELFVTGDTLKGLSSMLVLHVCRHMLFLHKYKIKKLSISLEA